tara:strand:- start:18863 stop:21355 length:2493 start_codon:yes stop_codon:yes gene_type:complete
MDHDKSKENNKNNQIDETGTLEFIPVLPLRDVVVYPHMVIPLFVGRTSSIKALELAMENNKEVFLVTQKDGDIEIPEIKDLYQLGTVAKILQLLKLPDNTVKVLVEGYQRAHVSKYELQIKNNCFVAYLDDVALDEDKMCSQEFDILQRTIISDFEGYIKYNKKIPEEILKTVKEIDDVGRLIDTLAAHLPVKISDKQKLLELYDIHERAEYLLSLMAAEIDIFNVEKRIKGRVKTQMEKSQKEYYLKEQIQALQKELGDLDDQGDELEQLFKKVTSSGMPKEALEKAQCELNKLRMMSPMAAEATVSRNYIDWMLQVPWKKTSKTVKDLSYAEDILEAEHYGLEKVKERILEYLAVQQRVKKQKGTILCLVGPPGVGKTSLGQSIANATNRKFIRMALGGVRDEAEIRGHRKTYIGSMPGKIIQKLSKVKVKNPLFLLDEIDKMSADFRGDPASALLEVLDPEQNNTFNDHYLEVDYDLSDVMFIATSNSMNIPVPLLDRMEVIRIAGYMEDEKLNIAKKYLIPSQIKNNGLSDSEIEFNDEAVLDIIRYYTKEAGVRSLDRTMSKICRKVVKEILLGNKSQENKKIKITSEVLEHYLGVKIFSYGVIEEINELGKVNGLAWTEVGGELLTIEASIMPGSGKTAFTGHLGDVMKESIQTAVSVIRSRSGTLKIPENFYDKLDIHIHVPEGATPKDGPSAGIGMCTALVSALTGIHIKSDIAMTGEITLLGKVLAIGGLKEKLLAAHRGNVKTVIIPYENEKDLKEMPDKIKDNLTIIPVKWIDEVLDIALVDKISKTKNKYTPRSAAEIISADVNKNKKNKSEDNISRH